MMFSSTLIAILVLHGISALVMLSVALFIFFKNPSALLNRLFLLLVIGIGIYEISFIGAPLAPSYDVAYVFSFLNVFVFLINALMVHLLFAAVELHQQFRWYLRGFYVVTALSMVSAVLYPQVFITSVEPKHVFPWYLTGGPLYAFMSASFYLALVLPLVKIFQLYFRNPDQYLARRGMYFASMLLIGGPIAYSNNALVYGSPLIAHPLFGSFLALSLLPVAYGILTDDLLDIRIIAKKALFYSAGIGLSVAFVATLIFLNNYLVSAVSWIQFWTIPIFSGVSAFVIGRLFWLQTTKSKRLKHDFITTATHKLNAPLAAMEKHLLRVRAEAMQGDTAPIIAQMEHAHERLTTLTTALHESVSDAVQTHAYEKEPVDMEALVREVVGEYKSRSMQKNITLTVHADAGVTVLGDSHFIRSVVEVLIENALSYSPVGSSVRIALNKKKGRVFCSVQDTGIGVSADEKKRIFTRFYRSDAAKRADTEGVGLGLAMAKSIVRAHGGRIGVDSRGEGQGSTFWFSLPRG